MQTYLFHVNIVQGTAEGLWTVVLSLGGTSVHVCAHTCRHVPSIRCESGPFGLSLVPRLLVSLSQIVP